MFNNLLSPARLKIFFITFASTFVVVCLQYLVSAIPGFISPVSPHTVDAFDSLVPLLREKPRTFSLKKQPTFIKSAVAATAAEDANAYAVIDLDTGSILASKNSSSEIPIASITKVMTAVVALDLAESSEYFTVTPNAARQIPTKIGVVPGQEYQLRELIDAILLTSANDAAQVIADGIDEKYGGEVFIRAMNKKARILGMEKTHFQNAQGFDASNHFSSAEDIAILTQYALTNYPLIAESVKKDYAFLPEDNNHNQHDLYNWNGLIGVYPGTYGVKIGNTEAAKKTTVVAANRDGKNLLVVLLGAPGLLERDLWSSELLNTGFAKFGIKPYEVTEEALREKYATWESR